MSGASEGGGDPHRLITLAFSHYNEKARWALDRCAMPYREERHVPFVCSLAVAVATRGRGGQADRTSSRSSTPVLFVNDGRVLSDSTDILRFAAERDQSLFRGDEITKLLDHCRDRAMVRVREELDATACSPRPTSPSQPWPPRSC